MHCFQSYGKRPIFVVSSAALRLIFHPARQLVSLLGLADTDLDSPRGRTLASRKTPTL